MVSFKVYYDYFPPKGMNVQVKQIPVGEINGVKSALKKSTMVAIKSFRAGETIYKAGVYVNRSTKVAYLSIGEAYGRSSRRRLDWHGDVLLLLFACNAAIDFHSRPFRSSPVYVLLKRVPAFGRRAIPKSPL